MNPTSIGIFQTESLKPLNKESCPNSHVQISDVSKENLPPNTVIATSPKKRKYSTKSSSEVLTPTKRHINPPNFEKIKNLLSLARDKDFVEGHYSLVQNELSDLQNHPEMQSNFEYYAENLVRTLIPFVDQEQIYDFIEKIIFPEIKNNSAIKILIFNDLNEELSSLEKSRQDKLHFHAFNDIAHSNILKLIGLILVTPSYDSEWTKLLHDCKHVYELFKSGLWRTAVESAPISRSSHLLTFEQHFLALMLQMPSGVEEIQKVLESRSTIAERKQFNSLIKVIASLAENVSTTDNVFGLTKVELDKALRKLFLTSLLTNIDFIDDICEEPDAFLIIFNTFPDDQIPPVPMELMEFKDHSVSLKINYTCYFQMLNFDFLTNRDCWKIVFSPTDLAGIYSFFSRQTRENQQKFITAVLEGNTEGKCIINGIMSECNSKEYMEFYSLLPLEQKIHVLDYHLWGVKFASAAERHKYDDSLPAYNSDMFRETQLFLTKAAIAHDGNCLAANSNIQNSIATKLQEATPENILDLFRTADVSNTRFDSFFNILFNFSLTKEKFHKIIEIMDQRINDIRYQVTSKKILKLERAKAKILELKKKISEKIKVQRQLEENLKNLKQDDSASETSIQTETEYQESNLEEVTKEINDLASKLKIRTDECKDLYQKALSETKNKTPKNQGELVIQLIFNSDNSTRRRFIKLCEAYSPKTNTQKGTTNLEIMKTFLNVLICNVRVISRDKTPLKVEDDLTSRHRKSPDNSPDSVSPLHDYFESIERYFIQELTIGFREQLLEFVGQSNRFTEFLTWRRQYHDNILKKLMSQPYRNERAQV